MSDWIKEIERRGKYVNVTIYDVPAGLIHDFSENVIKPFYPGGISPAIKDLMRKAVEEQKQKLKKEQAMSGNSRYPEPTVGALIINDSGQILLTKSNKWKDRLTLPGGHIEIGETIEEALKREIKEEVGLDVKLIRFLLMQEAIFSEEFYKPKHFIFLDYLCKAETTDVKIDEVEIQEFAWVNPLKALEMNLDSFARKTITKYLKTENML